MANNLLTIQMITRKSLQLFKNTNAFIKAIDKQYSSEFAKAGLKIGATLNIRKPNDYTTRSGDTAVLQATNEQYIPVTINQLWGVDLSFTATDLTLSMDDLATRVLAPATNKLAGKVAAIIMAGAEGGVSNLVGKVTAGATVHPDVGVWTKAGAVLDNMSAPATGRHIIMGFNTQANCVSSFAGLFNPQVKVGRQFETGSITSDFLGFDEVWKDQTVLVHTSGSLTTGTISGATQTGSTLTVASLSGSLALGDVFTVAGVYSVNRVTNGNSGQLQQFTVTAPASVGATTIAFYPPITPQSSGADVQYQTVVASPATGAVITPASPASEATYKNLALHESAVTMVSADLPLPAGTQDASREVYDGLSIRVIRDWITKDNIDLTRFDILFGSAWVRPEWAVVVTDALT